MNKLFIIISLLLTTWCSAFEWYNVEKTSTPLYLRVMFYDSYNKTMYIGHIGEYLAYMREIDRQAVVSHWAFLPPPPVD